MVTTAKAKPTQKPKTPAKQPVVKKSAKDLSAEVYAKKLQSVVNDPRLKKLVVASDVVVTGGTEIARGDIRPLPTQFPSLNLSIGIGGLPRGKIVEISGQEGGYKSSVCWAIAGAVQKSGEVVAWIDAEEAVDLRVPKVRRYLSSLGVDCSKVILIRPNTAEQAFKIIEVLSSNSDVGLIVFDSIVALSNQREASADMEKQDRNTLPQTINRGLRRCSNKLRKSESTLLLINQLRINQDRKGPFDKKFQTTGGQGLKHWCSLRLNVWARKLKNVDKVQIGSEININIEKTRFDVPRDSAKLFFYFAGGFDISEEVFELALVWGMIEKEKQSFVWVDHEKKVPKMSKAKFLEFLRDNETERNAMLAEIEEVYEDYYDPETQAERDVDEDSGDDEEDEEEEDE